jgi:carbonic anhydrase/acetyltransferase-like protein (isoleucine patch superfamily)
VVSDGPRRGAPGLEWVRRVAADLLDVSWATLVDWSTIRPGTRRARRFRGFGHGSAICFPVVALFGERYIELGAGTVVGPYATLSAGVSPAHDLGADAVVRIGDHCLIGKGSGIVGHERIDIGDDVFTGHHVYITDANHGYEDRRLPIGQQFAPPQPVSIGAGSWLGHGAIVLPGARIGRHVVVGAGSVVTGTLPDFSVAVGNPARVVRDGSCAQPPRVDAGEG